MTNEQLEKGQHYVIHSISKETWKSTPRPTYLYVFFDPIEGAFLYADQYFDYYIIKSLIDRDILQFDKIDLHQGIKMLQYKLVY